MRIIPTDKSQNDPKFKNPPRLAGIAGLCNPSSCCTERLVKEHKLIVRGRFTKGFDEVKLSQGKRDHSGEELFTCQLKIPIHLAPLPELRKFHLGRRHLPSRMQTQKLSSTLQAHRTKYERKFRNYWLLQ